MTEQIKKDTVKDLWTKIIGKGKFMRVVADDLNKSKRTLKNYWFSEYNDWSVPAAHLDRVIELMEIQIKAQNKEESISNAK